MKRKGKESPIEAFGIPPRELIGILTALIVLGIFFWLWFSGFEVEAVASAKATAYAASCTAMMNLHDGNPTPGLEEAWNSPVSEDIGRTCAETDDGRVTIMNTSVEVGCDDFESGDGSCRIYEFHLPQTCERDGELECAIDNLLNDDSYWKNFIMGVGDPKYLIYYEAFPQGPSQSWEVLDENWGMLMIAGSMVVGAATNVLFFGATKMFGGAAKKIAGKAIGRLNPARLLRSGDELAEVGTARRITQVWSWLGQPFRGGASTADDIAEGALGASIGRHISGEGFASLSRSSVRDTVEQVMQYRAGRDLAGRSVDEIAEGLRRGPLRSLPSTVDDGTMEIMSREMALALKGADEVVEGVGPAARLSQKEYWRGIARANSLADDMMEHTGSGTLRLLPDKVSDLFQKRAGFRAMKEYSEIFSQKWSRYREAAGFIACRSNAVQFFAASNADEVFSDNEDLEFIAELAALRGPQAICNGVSPSALYSTATSPQNIGAALLFYGWVTGKLESKSGKYIPRGINTIVLKRPFAYAVDIPFTVRTFEMSPYANYYFVNLRRSDAGQKNLRRFYYVSPMTTRNLGSGDPHIETHHTQLSCSDIDASEKRGIYELYTQPEWNNGQRMTPPTDGEWKNQIPVRTPRDPNIDYMPGESGTVCTGEVSDDCSAFNDRDDTESICKEVPGCQPVRHTTAGGTSMQDPVYYTCEGQPEPCDKYTYEADADVCEAVPGCSYDGAVRENPARVVSASGNGKKFCPNPGLIDEFTNHFPWVDNQVEVESIQISHRGMDSWETEDGNPIYGYNSADLDERSKQFGALAVTVVIDAAAYIFLSPAGGAAVHAVTGMAYAYIDHEITEGMNWPEH